MTEEEKRALIERSVLSFGQISAALACIREQVTANRTVCDAIGMVEQFADWCGDKLDVLSAQ